MVTALKLLFRIRMSEINKTQVKRQRSKVKSNTELLTFNFRPLVFILSLLFSAGCAYISPLVQDFNIISTAQEKQLGDQVASQVSKEMRIISGTAEAAAVERIGRRLLNALPQKDFDYKFHLVDNPAPNAFAIPGGSIYVHTGLLKIAKDESEVAGVIAHEIGHVYDRHPAKAVSRQYGADYLTKLLFKENTSQLKQISVQMAKQTLLLKYGRGEEFKADEIGYQLLKKAGYKTDGLARFFKTLQSLEQKGASLPFLSTHPPTPERIARLEALDRGQVLTSALGAPAPAQG